MIYFQKFYLGARGSIQIYAQNILQKQINLGGSRPELGGSRPELGGFNPPNPHINSNHAGEGRTAVIM